MTMRTWSALVTAAVIMCGSVQGQIRVLPLADEADPVRLFDAAFDATNPERPAITVRLENTTTQPLPTDRIWLSVLRFYTPDETRQNKDQVIWNCGLLARANLDQSTAVIQPGTSVQARLSLGPGCVLNPQHEHFSVELTQITTGRRFVDTSWKREPAARVRLLEAAMQKAH